MPQVEVNICTPRDYESEALGCSVVPNVSPEGFERERGIFISVFDGEQWLIASRRFARESDANAALRAMKDAGLDSIETIAKAGVKKVLQVQAEALAW